MEEILSHLLVPDNETILQATNALRQAFKNPDAVPALCNVLSSPASPQIRQYAAVVLRKRLTKAKYWDKLDPQVKESVKSGILPLLLSEADKTVKSSVVQFIAVIAKHEMAKGAWPDLQKFLQTLISSQSQSDVELAMFIMSVLTDVSLDMFKNQTVFFIQLFNHALNALDDLTTVLGYYTALTMSHTVTLCEKDRDLKQIYTNALPRIMAALPALIASDDDKACNIMILFVEILDSVPSIINNQLQQFIQFCLTVSSNKDIPSSVRNQVFCLIASVCRIKKKTMIKQNLLKPVVDVLFATMCERPEDGTDDEDEWYNTDDNETASQCAGQVLGEIAITLPPVKLLEILGQHIATGLQGGDKLVRKACYYAMGIVTEGASECIREKHLAMYIQYIKTGITDSSSVVRNAALFALAQVAEHLQPEVSEHAADLMPILFEYLAHLCQRLQRDSEEPKGVTTMFFALETFCENLDEKLVPYLPALMEHILLILQPKHSINVQELALSTLGSIAAAVKSNILPYFPAIIEKLKMYIVQDHNEESLCLQIEALQTYSSIIQTIGAEHVAPLAEETVAVGLKLLQSNDDPDLTNALYSLFAALSSVMKEQSASFLPIVMEYMILSIKSTEGLLVHYEEEEGGLPVYEDLSDSADEEDIAGESDASSEPGEIALENPYMDVKESAILALKELAVNTSSAFLPYLESSFEEVMKMTSFPYEDVRKYSFETLAYLCAALSKVESPQKEQALDKALGVFVKKCSKTALHDDEVEVAGAAVEAMRTLLEEIEIPFLKQKSYLELYLAVINQVLAKKAECQGEQEENEEDEEGDAEQDEILLQAAGEVIPKMGKHLDPGDFVKLLQMLMPTIQAKLSKNNSVSMRSFFIGTLAECMSPAGEELPKNPDFCQLLLSTFSALVLAPESDVRSNAIFGLGELILHGKQCIYSHYMSILQELSKILAQETHNMVLDNICGALARLVITNVELIPMDQVFPVFLEKLPLREDFEENGTIVKCFGHLYQLGHPVLLAHIQQVIRISSLILATNKGGEETMSLYTNLLTSCRKDFPAEMQAALQSLSPEEANVVTSRLSSS